MKHYFLKRTVIDGQAKILCSGAWLPIPKFFLGLKEIDCVDCLRSLLMIEEKRLALLRRTLDEAIARGTIQ